MIRTTNDPRRALLLMLLTIVAAAPVAAGADRPNIVLLLCDDLGYGDVRAFNPQRGKIATPHIDRLAADGMMFTDAHAPSSVCTPTRYGILTGRYCWRTRLQAGVLNGMSEPLLKPGQVTLASFLKKSGYATACIGKWHLGLGFGERPFSSPIVDGPLQHGFDEFVGISASLDMPPFAWIEGDRFPEEPSTTKTWVRPGAAAPSFEAVDVLPMLTRSAVQYVETHGHPEQPPYFLYLPLASPHTPIVPTAAWRGKSGLGDYADFVMETDAAVGQVLKAIDDAGQRDRTMVIFTSDNGFAPMADSKRLERQGHFPSAGFRGYKADAYEGGHRVPLIVRWPGVVTTGSTSDQLVELVDLLATAADVVQVGLPADAAADSVSFLPLLRGSGEPLRNAAIHHSVDGCFAVRDANWKLLLCAGSGGWSAPREKKAAKQRLPRVQLFDLAHDASEQRNVADAHPEIVARLTEHLQQAIANGRTTPGPAQQNDAPLEIFKRP